MKRKYARMIVHDIPKVGIQYMIDEIRDMQDHEARRKNRFNKRSIWVPIPDCLYDQWVNDLYVGDMTNINNGAPIGQQNKLSTV